MSVANSWQQLEWDRLKQRYNNTCPCCGRSEPQITLTKDHIVPIALGGEKRGFRNIQPLCEVCNMLKSSKHSIRFPIRKPREVILLPKSSLFPARPIFKPYSPQKFVPKKLLTKRQIRKINSSSGRMWRKKKVSEFELYVQEKQREEEIVLAKKVCNSLGFNYEDYNPRQSDAGGQNDPAL